MQTGSADGAMHYLPLAVSEGLNSQAVNYPDTCFILPPLQTARLLKGLLTYHRKGLILLIIPHQSV